VTANDDGGLLLQLQAIPFPAATVAAKPMLDTDDVVVTIVKAWPIAMDVFDGRNSVGGPVPILFTNQPAELLGHIVDNHEAFHQQLNKFSSR
jgi:hypothetical protein